MMIEKLQALHMLSDGAGNATIGANKQLHQTTWVVVGKSRWTILQLGNIAQIFWVYKQQTPVLKWKITSWRPALYQMFSVSGHKVESIIHPEIQCYCLLKSETILQLDDYVFKPPYTRRKHFLHWVQLWYIPMQTEQFSLFLYEKSPISSPSLNLSPNGLDKI